MTFEQALLSALSATWIALGGLIAYIRHLYDQRDKTRLETIADIKAAAEKSIAELKAAVAKCDQREAERQRAMEHQIETQQLALTTMARQNELIEALQAQVKQRRPRTEAT